MNTMDDTIENLKLERDALNVKIKEAERKLASCSSPQRTCIRRFGEYPTYNVDEFDGLRGMHYVVIPEPMYERLGVRLHDKVMIEIKDKNTLVISVTERL